MGGDGTICQVLNSVLVKQQGIHSTAMKPLNIAFGAIPTGSAIMFCRFKPRHKLFVETPKGKMFVYFWKP